MRPFMGTKWHKHLENWSFSTNIFNFLHVPTLDDFTWNLQSCFADLFHPVIFKSKSALFYYFPELPPSCFRASSAPPHTCSFTMAILAEPFAPQLPEVPRWLLIHHFRSPLRATGLLPLSDFLPHTWLFNCPDTFPTNPAVGSLPTFPWAMSDTPQKTFVLQQWEFVPSSVHSKEKLLLHLHQLTGREQGKFVKLTRLTLNTSLQKYFSLQMFWKFECFA